MFYTIAAILLLLIYAIVICEVISIIIFYFEKPKKIKYSNLCAILGISKIRPYFSGKKQLQLIKYITQNTVLYFSYINKKYIFDSANPSIISSDEDFSESLANLAHRLAQKGILEKHKVRAILEGKYKEI